MFLLKFVFVSLKFVFMFGKKKRRGNKILYCQNSHSCSLLIIFLIYYFFVVMALLVDLSLVTEIWVSLTSLRVILEKKKIQDIIGKCKQLCDDPCPLPCDYCQGF